MDEDVRTLLISVFAVICIILLAFITYKSVSSCSSPIHSLLERENISDCVASYVRTSNDITEVSVEYRGASRPYRGFIELRMICPRSQLDEALRLSPNNRLKGVTNSGHVEVKHGTFISNPSWVTVVLSIKLNSLEKGKQVTVLIDKSKLSGLKLQSSMYFKSNFTEIVIEEY